MPGDDAKEGIEKDPWQTRPDELEQRLAPWFDPESLCESASAREKLEARLYDIDSQRGTVDDAVRTVREILIVFMVASAYLAITVLATTDKQLLIGGASLKLPIVNAELNIVGFYLIAPWLVAVLHLNLLLKLALLSLKLALFEDAVAHAERVLPTYAERLGKVERTRLASFPIVQVLAGTRSGSSLNNLLRIFVWITLLFWPLAVLFMALIRFLPYHDPFHTWLQRGSIVFDLAILWLLWPQIINFGAGRGLGARFRALGATAPGIARALVTRLRSVPPKVPDMGRGLVASLRKIKLWSLDTQMQRMLRSRTMAAPAITAARMIPAEPARQRRKGRLALWLATVPSAILIWVATIPEEGLDAFKSAVTPEVGFIRAAVAADLRKEASPRTWSRLFPSSFVHACGAGGCDWLTFWLFEAPWSFVSRNLVVRGERLLKEEVKPEDVWELERDPTSKAKLAKFVPLDLRGRDLRYADLTDSKLIKVRLGADDRGRAANLSGALLTNATLISAEARAQFHGANLRGARLQGADLIWAKLQGADLSDALLQGAKLNGAQLQGANLLSANIQGADLSQVHLEGALLISARLQGVNLRGAQLQGVTSASADFRHVDLREYSNTGRVLTPKAVQEILKNVRDAGLAGAGFERLQKRLKERTGWADDLDQADLGLALCTYATNVPKDCGTAWKGEDGFIDAWAQQAIKPLLCGRDAERAAVVRIATAAFMESIVYIRQAARIWEILQAADCVTGKSNLDDAMITGFVEFEKRARHLKQWPPKAP